MPTLHLIATIIDDSALPCHLSIPQESPICTQCPTTCIAETQTCNPTIIQCPTRKRKGKGSPFSPLLSLSLVEHRPMQKLIKLGYMDEEVRDGTCFTSQILADNLLCFSQVYTLRQQFDNLR